ncbi:MAG: ABC transporter permease [Actinomycetaceae bacterium]|nr:ABC transporter permease [Actinomycetaceae bacterium]
MIGRLRRWAAKWRIALRIAARTAQRRHMWTLPTVLLTCAPTVIAIVALTVWSMLHSGHYAVVSWLANSGSPRAIITPISPGPITQDAFGGLLSMDEGGAAGGGIGSEVDWGQSSDAHLSGPQIRADITAQPVATFTHASVSVPVAAGQDGSERDSGSADLLPSAPFGTHSGASGGNGEEGAAGAEREKVEIDLRQTANPEIAGYKKVNGAPSPAPFEALFSSDLLESLNIVSGDTVDIAVASGNDDKNMTRKVRVIGEISGQQTVVVGPGTFTVYTLDVDTSQVSWYVSGGASLDWNDLESLNAQGYLVISRDIALASLHSSSISAESSSVESALLGPFSGIDPANMFSFAGKSSSNTAEATLLLGVLALLVITETILVVSPVYMAFIRTHIRTFGTLSTIGANCRDVRRVVLSFGIGIGVASAVLAGLLTAIISFVAALILGIGGEAVDWRLPLIATIVPLVVGIAAAFWPARIAAQTDIRLVISRRLRQRSSLVRRNETYPAAAALSLPFLALAADSGSIVVTVILGAIFLLALIGSLPWVMTGWSHLRGAGSIDWRLAMRDAVRHGHRSFPALASLTSLLVAAVAALVSVASVDGSMWNARAHVGPLGSAFVTADNLLQEPERLNALFDEGGSIVHSQLGRGKSTPIYGVTWDMALESSNHAWRPFVVSASEENDARRAYADRALAEIHALYIVDDGTWLQNSGIVQGNGLLRAVSTLRKGGVLVPGADTIDERGQAKISVVSTATPLGGEGAPMGRAVGDAFPGQREVAPPSLGKISPTTGGLIPASRAHELTDIRNYASFPASPGPLTIVILSPQAAQRLTLPYSSLGTVITPQEGGDSLSFFSAGQGPRASGIDIIPIIPPLVTLVQPYMLVGGTLVIVFATVILALTVVSLETRQDFEVMDQIGSPGYIRYRLGIAQGTVLTLHCLPLGLFGGLICGWAVVRALDKGGRMGMDLSFIVPWPAIIGLLIFVPIITACVALLMTPRRNYQ